MMTLLNTVSTLTIHIRFILFVFSDYSKAFFTNVGGFDWSLQFNWHPIPERDRRDRKRAIDPVRSPTMAGGLFSIDRNYFEKLGT
jgi:polypeptide N-acetylgalactosaminyltransferase